ncbi:helix-turn-helix domain-containing protein [Microbacterium sp. KNMS]
MDVTTDEAAIRLGVSRRRVIEMLHAGDLAGRQVHRTWLVDLASVRDRQLIGSSGGRPLSQTSARDVIDFLSFGARTSGASRKARNSAVHRSTAGLVAVLSQAVVVRRYDSRHSAQLAEHLHLTGESALDQIIEAPGANLIGRTRAIQGYPRGTTLEELTDEFLLIPDSDGEIAIHAFRDGEFPWASTPPALIAVDAARSPRARVREAGLRALEEMRERWASRVI